MSAGKKVFSEQEVSDIVRRAVELQEQGQDPPYTPGITHEELQRISREIGVDGKYLERAIREALRPEGKKGPFNFTEEFERVVDAELKQEDFDVLLEHLRPDLHGRAVSQVGRTLTGPTKSSGVSLAHVNVTSRNGRTKISVKSSPLLAYLIGLHPAVIGSIVALAGLGEHGMVGYGIAASVGLLSGGWYAFRKLINLSHAKARALADELENRVAEEAGSNENISRSPLADEDPAEQIRQRS